MSATKPVEFNNTVLRDGHQSLAATRMTTKEMLPVVADLDSIGFAALETWGGATIDSCLRYLNENPFDRLDTLKKLAPKTPHSMLLRGQNLLQYTAFPDDVVEAFCAASAKHGMDIFRIFDALNDTRNLKTAINAVKKAGKHAQGTICYTVSPVHTLEAFIKLGTELQEIGADSVCIKDMAGLISPSMAYDLVKALKSNLHIPVVLHSHSTSGQAAAAYYAATEAGIDSVDTSIVPFANGTGQPDTLRMLAVLEGHPRCPAYDRARLVALGKHFEKVYAEMSKFTSTANERTDTATLAYQVPGGMLSNFRNQLKEQGMSDRFNDVLKEIPVVREALGWIPLVTPTSQIVGTQAMLNVKFGRWKMLSQPAMDVALGKYGRTPAPVNADLLKDVEKKTGQQAVTVRGADLLQPGMEKLRAEVKAKGIEPSDENVTLYAMFPQEVEKIYKNKAAGIAPYDIAPAPAKKDSDKAKASRFALTLGGKRHEVTIEELN